MFTILGFYALILNLKRNPTISALESFNSLQSIIYQAKYTKCTFFSGSIMGAGKNTIMLAENEGRKTFIIF